MKKTILLLFTVILCSFSTAIFAQLSTHFVTTWKTDNTGYSSSTSIFLKVNSSLTYNYDVDWDNDGTFDEFGITGSIIHDFGTAGTYTIRIKGTFPSILFGNGLDKLKILEVNQWGDIAWSTMFNSYSGCSNLVINATDVPDLSGVTNLHGMFQYASNFNSDISSWDVSTITDMYALFHGTSFNQDISGWNVSSVTNMEYLFYNSSFNQDISGWDVSNVTNMARMFSNNDFFNQDISSWDVSSVTRMDGMFYESPFNQDIDIWDVSSVTGMGTMFSGISAVFNQSLNSWNVSNVTDMGGMFQFNDVFNGNISNWNVSNVTLMNHMFAGSVFTGDISGWTVSSVTNMGSMFEYSSFNSDISSWDVSNVTHMDDMFQYSPFNQDISSWDVSSVTDMDEMFRGNSNFNQNISGWVVSSVTDMSYMFSGASSFNQNISGWNVGIVTNMSNMFNSASSFNNDITGWDVSSVTDMSYMFYDISTFNQDLGGWDVSGVSDMSYMFYNLSGFNQDIGSWNVSLVEDMSYMFYGNSSFNQNIGNWDISNVSDMQHMLDNSGLSNVNYDYLLIGWRSLTVQTFVTFGAAGLYYCAGENEHDWLDFNRAWTITDAGIDCNVTWDGSESTDWNTGGNWDADAVPFSTYYNLSIPNVTNDPIIGSSDDATSNNLIINSGATLNVNSDASGTGSLLVNGSLTNSGTVNFQRYTDTYSPNGKWHYVSAPLSGQGLDATWLGNNSIQQYNTTWQFYRWDEPTNYWIAFGSTGSPAAFGDTDFADARGYCLSRSANGILSFTGDILTSDVSYSATYNAGQGDGYNLVGNPYSCSIGITSDATSDNNFLNDNNAKLDASYRAAYIWEEQAGYADVRDDYRVICNTGYSGFGSASPLSQDYVQPGQGFFIKVNSAQSITFSANSRAHSSNAFYKNHKNTWPGLELTLTAGDLQNSTVVAFHNDMTTGLDPSYDVGKFKGNPYISLYTRLVDDNGVDFTVQALPETNMESLTVLVGVDLAEDQLAEFSLEHEMPDHIPVFLEDRQQNTLTNLKEKNYSTMVSQGTSIDRFFLHFRDVTAIADNTPEETNIRTYNTGSTLYVINPDGYKGNISLISISGQELMNVSLIGDSKQQISHSFPAGCYIVRFTGNKLNTTKKIFVR